MTEHSLSAGTDQERPQVPHDSTALTAWLTTLVRNREYGILAELRRARGGTNAHIRAGWYGGADHRDLFERVAFLFAIYHQGHSTASYGHGSLGAAARRIGDGTGRGPDNPGAQRLLNRIVASRRIPWRHLQHAVTRLRACEQPPPSWTRLTEDLINWNDRKARIAYGWSVEFHTPPARSRQTQNEPTTRKDTTS
ncbi:type I-E CRISPR-associated protein Cse2/CasB [Streptomyces arenae]|uniref:type I-E CRISPR-associated protein Cse2/CasB n=1 Tax=Streptomyces arenae TaxID=29301 RepID=UPI00265AFD13|nr:type I-E CRISPR-associated protein Cse2/CasB [Streptomyces arenae]MCG7206404.1 type I-E CRISPR-associated protein Cse2/CasB [Streptomyces arenae]